MKTYEAFKRAVSVGKKFAKAGVIAASFFAIPYVCEGGCAYMDSYAKAAEKQEVTSTPEITENLEMILED
jgi:hypothetical protein